MQSQHLLSTFLLFLNLLLFVYPCHCHLPQAGSLQVAGNRLMATQGDFLSVNNSEEKQSPLREITWEDSDWLGLGLMPSSDS